jgi:hypothetical protein
MKNVIQIMLTTLITLLVLAGCAKKPKPWDNPELIKIEREDFAVLLAETTFYGHSINKDGRKGKDWKVYYKEDGTSEIWVHGMSTFDRGGWDTSNPQATVCTWWQNLRGGATVCSLLYKVKGADRYESYALDGRLKDIIREVRPGYHM